MLEITAPLLLLTKENRFDLDRVSGLHYLRANLAEKSYGSWELYSSGLLRSELW
jgi:hypothetical protein